MTSPKKALTQAKWLYDELALSPLAAACKYGDEYEPATDEDCLEVREMIEAAIPVSELYQQAVELLKRIVRLDEPLQANIIGYLTMDMVEMGHEIFTKLEALK